MAVFTIETPGGRKLRIEADDEAAAMAGAQDWHSKNDPNNPPGQVPVGEGPPRQNVMTGQTGDTDFTVGGAARQLGKFNKGVGDVISAGPEALYRGQRDIKNLVRGAVGAEPIPYDSPVQKIKDVYEQNFVPTIEPQNRIERSVARGAQQAGEAMPYTVAGGVAGLQAPLQRMVSETAPTVLNAVKGAGQGIANMFANSPVKATLGDMWSNVVGGTLGQVGKETGLPGLPESKMSSQAGEALGNIGGGLGAPFSRYLGPIGGPVQIGAKLAGPMLPHLTQFTPPLDKAADAAGPGFLGRRLQSWHTAGEAKRAVKAEQFVQKELGPRLADEGSQAGLTEASRLRNEIPGYSPTLDKATGEGELLNLGAKFDRNATGNELRQRQGRYDANAEAINQYADAGMPPVQAPEDVLQRGLQARGQLADTVAAGEEEAARRALQQQAEGLPRVNTLDAGEQVRGMRDARQQEMNATVREMRGAIDPGNAHGVEDLLAQREETGRMLRQVSAGTTVQSAQEAQALRARRAEIDDQIAQLEASGAEGVGDRLRAYNQFYRDEYVPRFGQDLGQELGQVRANSSERIKGEDIATRMFGPNNVTEARQFNLIHGEDPAARQQLTDLALDDIRRSGVRDGILDPGAVQAWATKHSRILDEMPWLRQAIEARDPQALHQNLTAAQGRRAAVAEENAPTSIDAALRDPTVMQRLRANTAGDPQAETALRRAVWDRAVGAGKQDNDTLLDANKLQKFIDDNRRSLTQVLEPAHMKNLDTVISAARMEGQRGRPVGTTQPIVNPVDKAIGGASGMSIGSLLSRVYATASGRTSEAYVAAEAGARVLNKQLTRQYDAVWKEALSNPQVAESLAAAVRGGSATPIQTQRLRSYLAAGPENIMEHRNDPEPPKQPESPFGKLRDKKQYPFTPRP